MNKVEHTDTETAEAVEPEEVAPERQSPLYTAINQIYGQVVSLQKTDRNKHGNYKFTPADDFRDAVRKFFYKYKLVYMMTEIFSSSATDLKQGTVKIAYDFVIIHIESGEETPRMQRSVFLPYVGSQTAEIASTFALKAWLRNMFLISTGEEDPQQSIAEADERAGQKLSVDESEEVMEAIAMDLGELIDTKPTKAALTEWKESKQAEISSLHRTHFNKIKTAYQAAVKKAPEA